MNLERFYYWVLSFSPRINPCPSCPYTNCHGKEQIGKGMDEIVGCSRWP
jgi:hypothetical protein